MWSDDDWLKKFSGKTAEEAEGEAAGGETTNTATQEVTRLLFGSVFVRLSLNYDRRLAAFYTQLVQGGTVA